MPYQPPPPPRTRRARIGEWLAFAFAATLVALTAYLGYVGFEGSRQFTEPPSPSADCRTPATLGWEYEAINYDAEAELDAAARADSPGCVGEPAPPGNGLVGPGGVGLAAWYVPAATAAGGEAPTVVLVHGWGGNKSNMLGRAEILHDRYNLLLLDPRNQGQSGEAQTTQGVREAGDLRAALEWLEAAKGPDDVAVLGVSMGGAAALAAAAADDRIDAIIVESTHATLANAVRARLEVAGYPLSVPGSWAILLGALVRTGEDVSSIDPLATIGRLDGRPVLLLYGSADDTIGTTDGPDLLAAATEAGSPAELSVCDGAGHAASPDVCAVAYAEAVLGFLDRAFAPARSATAD